MLPESTLYHVELRIESADLLKARAPELNSGIASDLAAIKAWAKKAHAATAYRDELWDRMLAPALACLIGAPDLPAMLAECGESAVLRISLEKPQEQADASPAAA